MDNNIALGNYSDSDQKVPWDIYPRPQMKRDSFLNLNGEWEFEVSQYDYIPKKFSMRIMVPYPVESKLSGVEKHFKRGTRLFYRRFFDSPMKMRWRRVLLHCGGIDQKAEIYINGCFVIECCTAVEGPMTVDITPFLKDENEIIIKVTDDMDKSIPYGKQSEKPKEIWYSPVSGIWQTVWIEAVPEYYIKGIKVTPTLDYVDVEIFGVDEGRVTFEGKSYRFYDGKIRLTPVIKRHWTPEDPHLYYFSVYVGNDKVDSYFALRTLEIKEAYGVKRLCLNGEPYFFHGVLHQGYWQDGLYTPEKPDDYKLDILSAKNLGFNTIRKHLKVEAEEFYNQCDRLGMIVFQDMVNNGKYSKFRDVILPTIGLKKVGDKFIHKSRVSRRAFISAAQNTVKTLYSHPSICYWTLFNEGWGQFCSSQIYDLIKGLDGTRIIDSASGWFKGGRTDVESIHCYFKKFNPPKADKPIILTEFGGYSLKVDEHSVAEHSYGYKHFEDRKNFMESIQKLYEEQIITAIGKGLCGCIYTQLTDVETETNGLITYDRKYIKADDKVYYSIAERLVI
ncbi:MAG: glycoside hydrolase family 2 [Lachnospiraceae bacterium]|nr:glycoside hydrolase family 2 [Lachnospiraceae bacterium]